MSMASSIRRLPSRIGSDVPSVALPGLSPEGLRSNFVDGIDKSNDFRRTRPGADAALDRYVS
jgi:hypothetical protein